MQTGSIQAFEVVFLLLLLFVVAFGALAKKLQTPYPIVLVIAGLLLSFVPGIPRIMLNPDVIFFLILPPLLYSAAWLTSWREFSYNLVSIASLAFGLVLATVLGVARVAPWFLSGFDWRMGFVLGAVVAPTDAIAATSIAKKVGMPKRIVDILEGESLVNDASGLLALEFGIAMLVRGETATISNGLVRLVYLITVGLGIGLVVGAVVNWVERRIDHGPIEIALSILVPYATYLAADSIRASGVLAVVACGLYLSRKSSTFFSASVRLQAWAVWDSLTFILNGLVFVLIGLQLPYVTQGIRDHSLRELLAYGALFSALLIVLRVFWIFPGAYFSNVIRRRLLHQKEKLPPARQIFVVGWTGMRGVISLAAAIALPQTLANGAPFAQRNLIIFLTFSVILVTLVLQGLTLPPLVRALGLAGTEGRNTEEEEARRIILEAALSYLEKIREEDGRDQGETYDDLEHHYRHRLSTLKGDPNDEHSSHYGRFVKLSRDLLRVERQTAVRLRNEGRINDELLRDLERELDLSETRFLSSGG
jgi:CPA1 family monovalent cation:H+ antiporter